MIIAVAFLVQMETQRIQKTIFVFFFTTYDHIWFRGHEGVKGVKKVIFP